MNADLGAAALNSVIFNAARHARPADDYDIAYFRGQISIVQNYLDAPAALIEEAKREVDKLRAASQPHQGEAA